MEKIVFEGTPQQVQLLKDEFEMLIIEHGKDQLPKLREDYQTENLWSVTDAQDEFECNREQALELLHQALTNEVTMNQIWNAIRFHGDELGLTKIEHDG